MSIIRLEKLDKDNSENIDKVYQLLKKAYTNVPHPIEKKDLLKQDRVFFLAYRDKDFIGCTGYWVRTPELAETIKTVVDPVYRGEGLGKLLSQAIEDECKKAGIKKVITAIYAANHPMISIKLKQGYTIEGYHPDHDAPGWHEYSLGKILK